MSAFRPESFRSSSAADASASAYLSAASANPQVQALKHRTLDALGPYAGRAYLEIGCGNGDEVRELARRGAARVVGVDINPSFAKPGGEESTAVEFVVADAHALPFADETFDGVRIERTLQHVVDPAAVLSEARRVLAPGGALVALEPDWASLLVAHPDEQTTRCVTAPEYGGQRHPTIGRRLRGLAHEVGFSDVAIEGFCIVVPDVELAERYFFLSDRVRRAVEDGAIDVERGNAWLAQLHDAPQTFAASVSGFIAIAR